MIRAGNCGSEINCRIGRVVRMFKWGASEELIPPAVHEALRTVQGLRKGRSVREKPPVGPVLDEPVMAIRAFVSRQVWAMIELQRLSGMRPGEVVIMWARDLDTSSEVWTYTPSRHKAEHHDKRREVLLGPRAIAVLRPWLRPDLDAYLFSPAEAMAELQELRRRRRKTPVQPRQVDRSKPRPAKRPGADYTVASYLRAMQATCDRAGIASWHPHQLRHAAATEIRKRFGIEAARIILGHEDVRTAQIYAEQDRARGIEVITSIG
jgi:integrase